MSAIGTKQTSPSALHMSAFDPKRTWDSGVYRYRPRVQKVFLIDARLIGLDTPPKIITDTSLWRRRWWLRVR